MVHCASLLSDLLYKGKGRRRRVNKVARLMHEDSPSRMPPCSVARSRDTLDRVARLELGGISRDSGCEPELLSS